MTADRAHFARTERLACLAFQDRAALHAALDDRRAAGAELLPVSTCRRSELFVLTADTGGARRDGSGRPAARRLFRLAAGVLSDVPGERAIAHQLRQALREATHRKLAGPRLTVLTRCALRAGDSVRERVERAGTPILELPDLVADLVRQARPDARIVLLGAGPLAWSVRAALLRRGANVVAWGTRRPRRGKGPQLSIDGAVGTLRSGDVLITALGGAPAPIDAAALPEKVLTIDLGAPANLTRADWTSTSVIARFADRLAPQRAALRRAARRLPALADAALDEILSPSVAGCEAAVTRYKEVIAGAELRRLEPLLSAVPAAEAERIARSIRQTAARCLHPLHEYVAELGRQGRVEEAATVVTRLLLSRSG